MPLDPEIAAYPETQKYQPPRSALDIAATRERLRQFAALAGPPAAVHRVEDLVLAGYLRARQYWPTTGPSLLLVAYFHGGRFISGDLDSHDAICRTLALAANCRVIAIDYRLAPEHRFPAAAEDAALAVQWALGQGTAVAVAGDSAGANLAAVLGKARFWDSIAGIPLNQRQRFMINRMLDGFRGKLTTVKWAKLTKCSHDTAQRDIKDLVARGVLVRNPAGGRSTSYSLAPDAH